VLSDPNHPVSFDLSRREVLRRLVLGGMGIAAGACAPVRLVLKAYPSEFDHDQSLTDRTLTAFVHTVTPGLPQGPHPAVRVLQDDFYPIAPYAAFLASDLDRRAESRFRRSFRDLQPAARRMVIQEGLDADTITRRLYTGAIFLTQISVYGGVHDDRAGSPLINFPGGYQPPIPASLSHPNVERFRARGLTADGNPA
jgi:hypothetical protein